MARPRKEWVGKTDATAAPGRVRLRNFDDHNGICHLCKLPIKPGETWETDHVKALINGGENRETNLAPVHKHCHSVKTGDDVAEKAKVADKRKKHLGIASPKQTIAGRGFPVSEKAEKRETKPALEPRQLFRRV